MRTFKVNYLYLGVVAVLVLLLGVLVGRSYGEAKHQPVFPAKPLTIVVTFPPGGGTDLLARKLGAELEQRWQQPVIIENRPGASGIIGARHVAHSPADGYSLLMVNSSFAINPSVYTDVGFDPRADFSPVINVAWVPSVLVVGADSKVDSVEQLLSLDEVNYASCGTGTPQHFAGELLAPHSQGSLMHVPYKGCGPALADIISGQVDVGIVTISSAMNQIKSGHLKALAVSSAQRSPVLPEVPTVAQSGIEGYELDQWHGLLAPANTPPELIEDINHQVAEIMAQQKIQDELHNLGYTSDRSTAQAFNRIIDSDLHRYQQLVQSIHLAAM